MQVETRLTVGRMLHFLLPRIRVSHHPRKGPALQKEVPTGILLQRESLLVEKDREKVAECNVFTQIALSIRREQEIW